MIILVSSSFEFVTGELEVVPWWTSNFFTSFLSKLKIFGVVMIKLFESIFCMESLYLYDSNRRGYSGFGVPQTVIIVFIITEE